MRTDDFDFDLPTDLIAQRPAVPRDAARLLAVGEDLRDLGMRDLADQLRPGDLLVFNDTRVIPARLKGRRGQAGIEVTLHQNIDGATWKAFARPARKLREGDRIDFADGFSCAVAAKGLEGEVTLAFDRGDAELMAALQAQGGMPLPPYIKREHLADERDKSDYQTLFAARDGAVAAPTAGLHFTPDMLSDLDFRGIRRTGVTLHVGAGTFLPVKVENVADHRMHAEWGEVGPDTAMAINATRAQGGRVVAVGTTSLRLLESAADDEGIVAPFAAETDIFITPGYRFKAVDMLLTNFHLPRSTLFMLVCAFAGMDRMKAAYAHAINAKYRFYSYGDGCLLERAA